MSQRETLMKRTFALAAAVIAALAFFVQAADAKSRRHVDKRVTAVALGTGAASTAAFFAINKWKWNDWNNASGLSRWGAWGVTTVGCAAVSPMIATVVLDRPLTNREAHVLIGSCVVPIVGGWLVNEAYNANPAWEPDAKPRHGKKKYARKNKKKM
jgi:hypothetical protein